MDKFDIAVSNVDHSIFLWNDYPPPELQIDEDWKQK